MIKSAKVQRCKNVLFVQKSLLQVKLTGHWSPELNELKKSLGLGCLISKSKGEE